MQTRYIHQQALADLKKKMVFIGGPRQVGKTTFSQSLEKKDKFSYLNWDIPEHRAQILKSQLPKSDLIVFDEIHKYRKWRGYLKGLYDKIKFVGDMDPKILVTGSARLDYYRFGGDSLQGRYFYFRLMPFSFHEIGGKNQRDVESLMKLGGFPEPFLAGSETEARRWSNSYISRLVHEEITSLEEVSDLGSMEKLAYLLPQYIGSPLSINNLRENFQVAHETVARWLDVFERLYLIFRLTPFTGNLVTSVKKERKAYFYNWTFVDDEGPRFENLIAVHLLKFCLWKEDSEGLPLTLHYTKQKNGPEIDFVVCEKGRPIYFIEAKLGDQEINHRFSYFKAKFPKAQFFQIHLRGKKDYQTPEGFRVCSALTFLKEQIQI